MTLTSAMLTGFTGITANGTAVATVGNNLANLNTTAFKSQRTLFETLLYQTISEGSAPDGETGGTLPRQVGLGVGVASLQRDFAQGGFEGTGFPSDLAIDGDGFFIVEAGGRGQVYTRDGAFRLDATQTMVSASGAALQVFPADEDGNILQGTLSNLVVPLGASSEAVTTTDVVMDGRLDSNTTLASAGAIVTSQALTTAGGGAATAATRLTDLVDINGVPLFAAADVLTIHGVKGGVTSAASTFVVDTTGSTLGDFAAYLESTLGIDTDASLGGSPGVIIGDGTDFPAGTLVVRSNLGEVNAMSLDAGSITNTTGAIPSPLTFTQAQEALGGGVTTTFSVFDSLGNQVNVRLRLALETKADTGNTWRFFAESVDDSDPSPMLGSGTITFDANGQFISATGTDLTIDRAGIGAVSPLAFSVDFSRLTGLAGTDGASELIMDSQNGAPAGLMTGYSIDAEGVVTGVYSNQLQRVLGQVALATFPNNEGLVALSENTYAIGPDSGDVAVVAPQTGRGGAVRSGALEQSNVEIAREFITLISASTGISSASRVIRVADDLLQELLLLAR